MGEKCVWGIVEWSGGSAGGNWPKATRHYRALAPRSIMQRATDTRCVRTSRAKRGAAMSGWFGVFLLIGVVAKGWAKGRGQQPPVPEAPRGGEAAPRAPLRAGRRRCALCPAPRRRRAKAAWCRARTARGVTEASAALCVKRRPSRRRAPVAGHAALSRDALHVGDGGTIPAKRVRHGVRGPAGHWTPSPARGRSAAEEHGGMHDLLLQTVRSAVAESQSVK